MFGQGIRLRIEIATADMPPRNEHRAARLAQLQPEFEIRTAVNEIVGKEPDAGQGGP